jgi:ABC-2 type transport system permease protein
MHALLKFLACAPYLLWPVVIVLVTIALSPRIRAVFKREFFGYFNSPVAYVILIIYLLAVQAFCFFFGSFLETDDASLTRPFFMWHPWIYMVLAPAVGMRLWSEEQRLGTMELLMTMPISPTQTIIGKFLAAAMVWYVALVLTFPIVITVYYLGEPDVGPILSAFNASFLYAMACLAVTCAVSAFTRSQVICFIISVALCLMLTLMGMQQVVDVLVKSRFGAMEELVRFIASLCFLTHYYDMSKGLLVFRDILYFASVIFISLMVTHYAIQSRRS